MLTTFGCIFMVHWWGAKLRLDGIHTGCAIGTEAALVSYKGIQRKRYYDRATTYLTKCLRVVCPPIPRSLLLYRGLKGVFTSRIAEREGPWPCGPGEPLALRARLPPNSLGIAMTRPASILSPAPCGHASSGDPCLSCGAHADTSTRSPPRAPRRAA